MVGESTRVVNVTIGSLTWMGQETADMEKGGRRAIAKVTTNHLPREIARLSEVSLASVEALNRGNAPNCAA
jgi:hypothetical protein